MSLASPMRTSSSVQSVAGRIADRVFLARKRFPFATNVATLSGGASLGHCFTLAAAPILTRLYLPHEIGSLGLFNAFLGVAAVAACLQYDVAIVCADDEREAIHLTVMAVLFALPVGLGSGLLFSAMTRFSLLGFGTLPPYAAWLMAAGTFFAGLFSALRYWSIRNEQFGVVSQALLFQNGGRSVVQVVFGAIGAHSFGLLFGEALGRCIGMSRMLRTTWPVMRKHPPNARSAADALIRHRRFPLYSMPSSLLNLLGTSLPLPLLVTLYGGDAGGYYSLVWRVLAVPVVLVGTSMADAFHSQAALYARNDPRRLLRFFHNSTVALIAIGIIPAIAIFVFGQPIFLFIFGGKWRISGAIASIVAPWFLTSFVVSPLSRLVYVLHGQRLKLIYDVAVLGGNLLVFDLAYRRSWPMLHMVAALSVMNTASRVVYYLVLLRIATSSYRTSTTPVPTDLTESSTS
ncbi:MAG: lipopolysaccharide biosynthesis protein [Candidatus Sulfotelmatobacter sp.]